METKKKAKRAVAAAKQEAYENICRKLDTKEGENAVYRVAKQRDRTIKDVQQVRMIKDERGGVLTRAEEVLKRWKDYFEGLMNVENPKERRESGAQTIDSEVQAVNKEEVKKAFKKMKKNKAVGPDNIP